MPCATGLGVSPCLPAGCGAAGGAGAPHAVPRHPGRNPGGCPGGKRCDPLGFHRLSRGDFLIRNHADCFICRGMQRPTSLQSSPVPGEVAPNSPTYLLCKEPTSCSNPNPPLTLNHGNALPPFLTRSPLSVCSSAISPPPPGPQCHFLASNSMNCLLPVLTIRPCGLKPSSPWLSMDVSRSTGCPRYPITPLPQVSQTQTFSGPSCVPFLATTSARWPSMKCSNTSDGSTLA